MKMKNQKGFTLIELLVVIAIIGLLSTIAVVAMGSARAKARDAKRISDIKQMSTILDVEEAAAPGTAVATCVLANAKTNTCTGPGDVSVFVTNLNDPDAKGTGTACPTLTAGKCDYSISTSAGAAAATTANYRICFNMDSQNQFGAAGLYRITNGGTVTAGCV